CESSPAPTDKHRVRIWHKCKRLWRLAKHRVHVGQRELPDIMLDMGQSRRRPFEGKDLQRGAQTGGFYRDRAASGTDIPQHITGMESQVTERQQSQLTLGDHALAMLDGLLRKAEERQPLSPR